MDHQASCCLLRFSGCKDEENRVFSRRFPGKCSVLFDSITFFISSSPMINQWMLLNREKEG